MKTVRKIFEAINKGLLMYSLPSIDKLVRLNQYSGMVSDFMTRLLDKVSDFMTRLLDKISDFKKLANTDFPDLRNARTNVGWK